MFDGSPTTLAFEVVVFLVACDNQTGGYIHSTGSLAEKSYFNHYTKSDGLSSGSVVNDHAGDGSPTRRLQILSPQGTPLEPNGLRRTQLPEQLLSIGLNWTNLSSFPGQRDIELGYKAVFDILDAAIADYVRPRQIKAAPRA